MKYRYGNIPVIYEPIGMMPREMDLLPSYLAVDPVVGHIVESAQGNRWEIKEITHVAIGQVAGLRIGIGKPSGGTSPASGGGMTSEADW